MIKSIKIESWCISCRNCETVCPKIFRVNPTSKVISNEFVGNETEILMAEAMCPVNVIKVEKKWTVNLNFKESEVISKKYLTSSIIELIVEKPINFSFKAGQYISVMFDDWKWKFSRQYSIAWENSKSFALTIRLAEKWRWAAKLKKLKVWQKIKFLWALGGFYLQNTEKEKYFISTGTWLAPFIAMAEKTAPEVKKHFIIWARKKEEFYYTERLKSFENTEIHYYLSGEEVKWYNKWRVTEHLKFIPKDAEIYICGNPAMVHSVLDYTNTNWYKNVYSEDFTVSGKYEPIWKEIFINWKIPFLKEISCFFIILWFLFAWLSIYKTGDETLYDNFLFFSNYQSLIFNLSWFAVIFVMLIRPISDIFSKSNFLRSLKTFRKPLWIFSSLLIIATFTWEWFFDLNTISNYFSLNRWNSINALIPRITEVSAVILAITSNVYSQKLLGKNWKRIQYLSYAYFIFGWLNWALNAFNSTIWTYIQYYWIVWFWLILVIISGILNYSRNKQKN